MYNRKNNAPFASRRELVISIALACLNITVFGLFCEFTQLNKAVVAVCVVLIYLLEIAALGVLRQKQQNFEPDVGMNDILLETSSTVIKNTNQPIATFDEEGKILWCNDSMLKVLRLEENPIGMTIDAVFGSTLNPDKFGNSNVTIKNRLYSAESFILSNKGNAIYMLSLTDVTALSEMEKKYNENKVCIAYIAIDNIEDVLQYVHEKFRVAVSRVDEKLKNWADTLGATIKSYDNDKYIMFFDSVSLDKCIDNRFSILDEIRETRVGDGVSITISMGVSRMDGSLRDRELAARDAIDLALQRGGDQVVYINNGLTEYYGGRTKSIYKRSNVRSRTFTNQLTSLMVRADNVLIMGHRYGDFDSFGAAIGVSRIALTCGVKVNIAVEMRDKNLEPCIKMMQSTEPYAQMFVDNADGLDLVGEDTLLVLVDHNDPARSQFADIASKVNSIVVIDHHRKVDTFHESVKLYYVEPSASSACELVTEMLESAISSQNLLKEEADMMLAGVLLDTKQFTRNTGTRTFGAAQYLRGAGANPTDVYSLFKTAPDDLRKESRFHTAINIYRSNIALSSCEGETDETYRIIASKAADKMLTLQGIDAAFTLVKIGDQIHISGRSSGTINVQLILEKLHGGGHFDVAGAQVVNESVMNVLETLKQSIDDYFSSEVK
jgi:c-di-AMP phosphodiesterase-like protein